MKKLLVTKARRNSFFSYHISRFNNLKNIISACDKHGVTKFCIDTSNSNVKSSVNRSLNGLYIDGYDKNNEPIAWAVAKETSIKSNGGNTGHYHLQRNSVLAGYYYKENGKWFGEVDLPEFTDKREYTDSFDCEIKDTFFKTFNFIRTNYTEIISWERIIIRYHFRDFYHSLEIQKNNSRIQVSCLHLNLPDILEFDGIIYRYKQDYINSPGGSLEVV